MTTSNTSDYERLGGADGLEALVRAFIDRVFDDFIIGFQFVGRDKDRIVMHETAHAAQHLGGPDAYAGRPVHRVHHPLKINRGQFRRRLAILRTVLSEHQVPADIVDRWVAADQRMEAAITDGSECLPEP